MSKSKKPIFNALPIVAAAYGEKFGVKITIGGDTAYTDGRSINLPNVPDSYPNKDVLWGYLAHEAAHVRFTDFSVDRRPGLHAALSNILEDCRIERAMMGEYPGTAQTLNEVATYMAQAGHYEHPSEDSHPATIIQAFCLYWLQSQAVGQTVLNPFLDASSQVLQAVFPQGVVVRLNALLRKAVNAQSTAEVVTLSEEIMKMLEEEQQKEEQQDQSQQQQQQGEGWQQQQQSQSQQQQQGGDSQQQGAGGFGDEQDQQDQSGSQASGQGNSDDGAENDASGQSASDGSQSDDGSQAQAGQASEGTDGSDEQQSQNQSPSTSGGNGMGAEAIRQALNAQGDDLMQDVHDALKEELNAVANSSIENAHYQTVRDAVPAAIYSDGRELVNEVKGTTAKIRSQLYGLVQASQRSGVRHKRAGKRLDSTRLCRVMAGDTRVFRTPTERQRPNTAVHILVDMSSSMTGVDEQIAREASMALALALEAIPGVNPAVTYFCDNSQQPVYSVVKHGQSVVSNAGRFLKGASGGTPMAEGIWYSAFELSKTREDKKMMIVVTDGAPNYAPPTKAVIDLCERSDINVVGIGIRTHAVAQFFTNHIVINEAGELRNTLFKLMERSLIPNAA